MEWYGYVLIQIGITIIIWRILRTRERRVQSMPQRDVMSEGSREMRALKQLRARTLNIPLSEKARPDKMDDIIGQDEGIKALRAAMCGPNPQHVIIYGPPGIGKTCAARLVLEEAKLRPDSPFNEESEFVEVDATCVRFDERSIADPLIGSVHDPIYQGAGAMGAQGIPQPKPGAVTRAHCGILFLDEIGELHPIQMSKLLKVLEDRRVSFDSAYYSKDNHLIPPHIHDVFLNGMPADFRLVGATTRSPEEIPPALRSRCVELFFRALNKSELEHIAKNAAERLACRMTPDAAALCAEYAGSGRDAVNIVQMAGGAAYDEGRDSITAEDVEWVARVCKHIRHTAPRMSDQGGVGVCTGLGVANGGFGVVVEVEAAAVQAEKGMGKLMLGGVVEEEEIELRSRRLKRKSTVRVSAENVCLAFFKRFCVDCRNYDVAFNIPGGIPLDGPSAGVAFAVALMSALTCRKSAPFTAFTGEVTVQGEVRPVGGIREKVEAAVQAGAAQVVIPLANWEEGFEKYAKEGVAIIGVSDIAEVMRIAFDLSQKAGAGMVCSA